MCISKKMIDMFIDPFNAIWKTIVGFVKRLACFDNVIVNALYKWSDFTNGIMCGS